MTETNTYREIEYFTWKVHKEQQHLLFLDKCRKDDILPKFCQIPQKIYKRLLLRPQNSLKIQYKIFNSEYDNHKYNLIHYQHQLNYFYHNLLKITPYAYKTFSIIESRIQQ